MKGKETPKQNKWLQGAYFNKQVDRMITAGMDLKDAEKFARKQRGL